jgi:hydroxymethylglutaryl-CoA reductase
LRSLIDAPEHEWRLISPTEEISDLAEVMVESALGAMPVPLGVASNLLVDGRLYQVPMAVEEPSVIAAATYAGGLISRNGGFSTEAAEPVMSGQVLLEEAPPEAESAIEAGEDEILRAMAPHLERMSHRGGGYLGLGLRRLPESDRLLVELYVDVRDAMGANIINSAAEAARPVLERLTGARALMAILTNSATRRVAKARFEIPFHALRRGDVPGEEMARRIVAANRFALEDRDRAVTHNKGIMNGVSSIVLATGNDTRAVEAAAHAYAAGGGAYRALTNYEILGKKLRGELELPLALGTVGGASSFHPVAILAIRLLSLNLDHTITSQEMSRVAVSVGLAQNLAAVSALVGEGIQKGHMRLHAKRIAWKAGATGEEIGPVSLAIWESGRFNEEEAKRLLSQRRSGS